MLFRKTNIKKYIGIFILFFLVVNVTSCDHTELTGNVWVMTDELQVNSVIPLILEVDLGLEDIYRVYWNGMNQDDEIVSEECLLYSDKLKEAYTEEELLQIFSMDYMDSVNYDRQALFIPEKAGNYTIEVYGFYKQTNPQPITTLELTIID